MTKNEKLRKMIVATLQERQTKNPQYSLRAYALSLGVHSASLSSFLSGKRDLSPKGLEKMALTLGLPKTQLETFIVNPQIGLDDEGRVFKKKVLREKIELRKDAYDLVEEPVYFSILSYLEIPLARHTRNELSSALSISEKELEQALDRLLDLGVLDERDGRFHVQEFEIITTDGKPNLSLRKRHAQNLLDAREALDRVCVEDRDFSFGTIAINKSKLPQAKKMIRAFQDQLFEYLQAGEKDQVYEICFSVFPRSSQEK